MNLRAFFGVIQEQARSVDGFDVIGPDIEQRDILAGRRQCPPVKAAHRTGSDNTETG
ncbi:MAG: hypothetical protein OET44_10455 [Gammaproteobacteria bacterium]|nr:hypothetical protein [Gammaproteobacteria bacterium]